LYDFILALIVENTPVLRLSARLVH